jgi:MFS superfamily sulfate permease-like transporter
MIKYSFRILALVLLFIIILVQDIPYTRLFKSATLQLYLAILVMLILLMFDNVTGFILGICLLVLYFKIYNKELKKKKNTHVQPASKESKQGCSLDKPCDKKEILENYSETNKPVVPKPTVMQIAYVTEENLLAAQNNIVNTECYSNEVMGVANQNVYGPQGLDKQNSHIRGYDMQNALLGSMNYDIL